MDCMERDVAKVAAALAAMTDENGPRRGTLLADILAAGEGPGTSLVFGEYVERLLGCDPDHANAVLGRYTELVEVAADIAEITAEITG